MIKNSGDRIPSRAECEEIMVSYAMQPHIIKHSIQVMNVSLAIIDNLKSGLSLDRDLVVAGALLHDITKTISLEKNENHAVSGGALLRELGFPSTAEVVEQHIRIVNFRFEEKLEEREVVYYADKRVRHDTIVTIEERMYDIIQRYATTDDIRRQIIRNKSQALLVEQKIAGFTKYDLHQTIRAIAVR